MRKSGHTCSDSASQTHTPCDSVPSDKRTEGTHAWESTSAATANDPSATEDAENTPEKPDGSEGNTACEDASASPYSASHSAPAK